MTKRCVVPGCERNIYPHTENPLGICHRCRETLNVIIWFIEENEKKKGKEKRTKSGLILPTDMEA